QQLKERLLKLDSGQFERVIGELLKALGMERVTVTGRTNDGGIDAEGAIPFINIKVAVQAKRYAPENSVGIDPVQRLLGSVVSGGFDRGIFITTSSFTAGARETAGQGGSKVVLLDGGKLVDIMVEKGLGIREVPIVKKELDEGFFGSIAA
ncbi:MAG: restriction endonuclease, partial [Chloroflexota bacterium]|nr:restriction endonuclease [Chloroflexota bacterium]